MSSPADSDGGLNAVMCYFPWFPYYLRYQIGFDIAIPPDAQADPSGAGQPKRLIHVRLYFPDGFICNPATFSGIPHPFPAAFRGMPPPFFPPHPHFHPPMFPGFPPPSPHFHRRIPMGFPGRMMWEEQYDARVIAYVVNGEPGEFMVIDDTPYDVIHQCDNCGEFHREPEHIHNLLSRHAKRESSEQPETQPENSHQDPSTSGITRQKDTSHTSPRKADEGVATDQSRKDTSRASPRKASRRVSRDRKNRQKKEDKTYLTQPTQEETQTVPQEGTEGLLWEQWENYTTTSVCSQPTPETIAQIINLLDLDEKKNGENVHNDNTNPGPDPNGDN